MKLNALYEELNDIIINKNNDYIKMINFESSTPRSLIAAFDGIYNTVSIINYNNKYNITIEEYINKSNSKKIFLKRNNNNIVIDNILDSDANKFTITAIYSDNIM
mgnify:CR=1 FL=1|tara:strand:- start:2740 stop:3054 length:315 start_codon:yes stop_codon:yes gene_type:complete